MKLIKTTLAILVFAAIGVAVGLSVTAWRFQRAAWDPKSYTTVSSSPEEKPAVKPNQPNQPSPKAFIDKTEYEFGVLDITGEGTHDFTIENRGAAPLKLAAGETSCRCTVSKLENEEVAPGKSTKVTLNWKPKGVIGKYKQTAKIKTNDPARPEITLAVSGEIAVAAEFSPAELVFSQITMGGSATAQSRLYCNLEKPIKILSHAWEKAETAPFLDAAFKPLSDAALADKPGAKSGFAIVVTAKPGLQQGPFRQKLIVKTDLPHASEQTLQVEGSVGSEITIAGADWDYAYDILNIGALRNGEATTRHLLLMVRGPHRNDVAFKATAVDPKFLKVEIGKSKEINHGTVVQTSISVAVPADSPVCSHLGGSQGSLATIDLETTHPQVPKLRLRVRFAVEE
jgi:hypothetical protein